MNESKKKDSIPCSYTYSIMHLKDILDLLSDDVTKVLIDISQIFKWSSIEIFS